MSLAIVVILTAFCIWALLPIAWGFVSSVKPDAQVVTFPPRWLPDPMTADQYVSVLSSNLPRYVVNSVVVAVLTVGVTLFVAAHAAYSVARFDFPGKRILLFAILATMMIARLANIVPLYIVGSQLGLLDTHFILIAVYSGWQVPLIVWLLRDFFEKVPPSLDRAAMIDGYSRMGAFYRISLPLARPGLIAAAILVFVYVWNDFIIALTLTSSESMRLVTVGLYNYVSVFGIRWGELMAGVVLALLPVVTMFVLLQRLFIRGMTSGALKG